MVKTFAMGALALLLGAVLLVGCGKKKPAEGAAVPQLNSSKITTPDGKTVEGGSATTPSEFEARVKGAQGGK